MLNSRSSIPGRDAKRKIVELQKVSKVYQTSSFGDPQQSLASSFFALKALSFDLRCGEFLYLVGGSGAGKSSLLKLLATDEVPTSGEIAIFGKDLSKASRHELNIMRKNIGYVPQYPNLIPDLTVFENVSLAFPPRLSQFQKKKLTIQNSLALLNLLDLAKKKASALSGGEAQRVCIARALAQQPSLLLLDEPTGAQDREYTWLIMDLLLKLNLKGTTLLMATHDREIVRKLRKPCASLKKGLLSFEESMCLL